MADSRALATFHAHGGRVAEARALFGGSDWIDLSTGIAPWAWPTGKLPLIFDRLPEPGETRVLEAAAARAFGAPSADHVVAVPGTDLAMRLLARILAARSPGIQHPAYAGHLAAWPGAQAVTAPDDPAITTCDLLALASPANPDGRVCGPTALATLAQRIRVVVDEAYADPDRGACAMASDRLVVLRSFGKFYGLPGLRLGFVIAGPHVTVALRALLGDWPVSLPATAIGTAAYRDTAWRCAQLARIREAGESLDRLFADAGLPLIGRAPLFRLIRCDDAAGLFVALAERAILTRPFTEHPDHLRIGLPGNAAALGRLAAALEEFQR